jgi:hypothetical protein
MVLSDYIAYCTTTVLPGIVVLARVAVIVIVEVDGGDLVESPDHGGESP